MRHGRTRFSDIVLIERHEGIKATLQAIKARPAVLLPAGSGSGPPQRGVRALLRHSSRHRVGAAAAGQTHRRADRPRHHPPAARRPGLRVRFYPPWDNFPSDDVEADVARMNAFIEDRIREMPPQYLWLHRRFKTRPEGEASLYE